MDHRSLNCCDLINDKIPTFKFHSVIGDQDYLSSLDYDCLHVIFGFLNHDDLDLISQVSQKMKTLEIQTRPTIRKRPACKLKVYRNRRGDICVKLSGMDGLIFYMRLKNNQNEHNKIGTVPTDVYADMDYNATRYTPIVKEITCGVYKRIRYLTDRFSITTLELNSITIDRQFTLHIPHVFKFDSTCKIIADINFEDETNSKCFQKFTNFMVRKKPEKLELCTAFFRERKSESQFINELIQNKNCPEFKLFLRSVYDADTIRSAPLPLYFYDTISKFDTFDFPCFVVDSNRIIKIVLDRLDRERQGMLRVRVDNIDQNLIETEMKHRKMIHRRHNMHEVYSVPSDCRALIIWNENRFKSFDFYVSFPPLFLFKNYN